MTPPIIRIEVSVRRELRRQERCLGLLSPDGDRTVVICRRQVEVMDVLVVVQEVDEVPTPSAPILARLTPRLGNTSAVNDGVPRYQENAA
jgi:hypothetical protein